MAKAFEFKLTQKLYVETLLRAVETVRFQRHWKLHVTFKGGRCIVKLRRIFFPITILISDERSVKILRPEGWIVWRAYQERALAQEPLRRMINELRFRRLMSDLDSESG